jgi:copper chaperone CopZ
VRTVLGLTILLALPLSAELRKVEMTLGGLDCDSCALSVDRVVKRIRGVDTATYDAKANLVIVTFKPDNKVQLSAIRDAVKGVGYTPGEVRVSARGSLTQEGGQWQFQVTGPDTKWKAEVPQDLRKQAGADVVVEGTLAEKTPDVLGVKAISPAQ